MSVFNVNILPSTQKQFYRTKMENSNLLLYGTKLLRQHKVATSMAVYQYSETFTLLKRGDPWKLINLVLECKYFIFFLLLLHGCINLMGMLLHWPGYSKCTHFPIRYKPGCSEDDLHRTANKLILKAKKSHLVKEIKRIKNATSFLLSLYR